MDRKLSRVGNRTVTLISICVLIFVVSVLAVACQNGWVNLAALAVIMECNLALISIDGDCPRRVRIRKYLVCASVYVMLLELGVELVRWALGIN